VHIKNTCVTKFQSVNVAQKRKKRSKQPISENGASQTKRLSKNFEWPLKSYCTLLISMHMRWEASEAN
jgi:hypothetical protein